jgi:hypothetical protein
MIARLLCRLGLHRWRREEIQDPAARHYGIRRTVIVKRECQRCGAQP